MIKIKPLLNIHKNIAQVLPLPIVEIIGQRKVLRGDNHHYKKFVIFSYQRCGSTLLLSTLGAHPSIHCYSEVFNRGFPMLFTDGIDHHSPWLKAYRDRDPLGFLNRFIFDPYPTSINAVGFKIFPEHFTDDRFREVVDQLIGDPDVTLFHLQRQNKLAVLLSLKRAQMTGMWSNPKGKKQKVAPIQLSVAECESFFRKMEASERRINDTLGVRQDVEHLEYENLVSAINESFADIQRILKVEPKILKPVLHKQNKSTLSDAIANFDDLKQAFADSQWSTYFKT